MPLTTFLSMCSTLAIVAGGIFAAVQLRQLGRQRARESALQLVRSAQTSEFLMAINIVFDLPEGLSKKEIEKRLGEKITSVYLLFGTFESLGILVFRKEIDIRLVEDFFSGVIILSGRKLKRYLLEMREQSGRQTYYEWFQWLHELVDRRESVTPAVPAFVAFRDRVA